MEYLVDSNDMTTVANAIRTKGGTSAQLEFPNGMAQAIAEIPAGVLPVGSISITENGTYDVTQYASAVVNVNRFLLPYVTDGLLICFDGIENTRNGHDASTTVWEDLSGNKFDISCPDSLPTPTVLANGFRFNGVNGFLCTDSSYPVRYSTQPGTLEVVFKHSANNAGIIFIQRSEDESPDRAYAAWYRPGSNGYRVSNTLSDQILSEGVLADYGTEVRSLSVVFEGNAAGDFGAKLNGEAISRGTTGGNLHCLDVSFGIGCRRYGQYGFTGDIFAVRLYNRVLTEAERLRNYQADAQRFGIV